MILYNIVIAYWPWKQYIDFRIGQLQYVHKPWSGVYKIDYIVLRILLSSLMLIQYKIFLSSNTLDLSHNMQFMFETAKHSHHFKNKSLKEMQSLTSIETYQSLIRIQTFQDNLGLNLCVVSSTSYGITISEKDLRRKNQEL